MGCSASKRSKATVDIYCPPPSSFAVFDINAIDEPWVKRVPRDVPTRRGRLGGHIHDIVERRPTHVRGLRQDPRDIRGSTRGVRREERIVAWEVLERVKKLIRGRSERAERIREGKIHRGSRGGERAERVGKTGEDTKCGACRERGGETSVRRVRGARFVPCLECGGSCKVVVSGDKKEQCGNWQV
ncbi:hypothetical protein CRYUN_Cryun12cG0060700 [Craigia yunnanensis]